MAGISSIRGSSMHFDAEACEPTPSYFIRRPAGGQTTLGAFPLSSSQTSSPITSSAYEANATWTCEEPPSPQMHPVRAGEDVRVSAFQRVVGALRDHDELVMHNTALQTTVAELRLLIGALADGALAVVAENQTLISELQLASQQGFGSRESRSSCSTRRTHGAASSCLLQVMESVQETLGRIQLPPSGRPRAAILEASAGTSDSSSNSNSGSSSQELAMDSSDGATTQETEGPQSSRSKTSRHQRRRRAAARNTAAQLAAVEAHAPASAANMPMPVWVTSSPPLVSESGPVRRTAVAAANAMAASETRAPPQQQAAVVGTIRAPRAVPGQYAAAPSRPQRPQQAVQEGETTNEARAQARTVTPLMPLPCAAAAA